MKVPKRYVIKEAQVAELEAHRKQNKNKRVENRLKALLLHAEGRTREEIMARTEFSTSYISKLVSKYCRDGLDAIVENKYPGNRRNMSFAEEEAFLAQYIEQAEQGHVVEVIAIKQAYQEKVGHAIGGSQIYYVLARHGWRKVMPRSRHPKKASEEAVEASKKIT